MRSCLSAFVLLVVHTTPAAKGQGGGHTSGREGTFTAAFDGATPLIDVELGLFSERECADIIDVCNDIGWNQIADSIDASEKGNHFSQDIYVFDRGVISNAQLWDMIKPRIPALAALVKKRKVRAHVSFNQDVEVPTTPPSADWVFIRKYSPSKDSTRNSKLAARALPKDLPVLALTPRLCAAVLRVHHDINEHSVNIPLNSDTHFEGGGFFVIKPPPQQAGYRFNKAPDIEREYQTLDWLKAVKRANTSTTYFPPMSAGAALLHNNTVWHGIAPLTSGTKYRLEAIACPSRVLS